MIKLEFLLFPWQPERRDDSFTVAKYGSGYKIKNVYSIKFQALNVINKQRFIHVNQLLCREKKETARIPMPTTYT
jgi:hypothetical protein